ncbi:MAG: TIGR00730 family Rossman fold protein [Flavobacteriaceae bacterium]|nr:TIGR00730 family Rossman fold protein [Flavobacteriaceae bacterium]
MKKIAVFCGSSEGNDDEIIKIASNLGLEFAKRGITLVYGGANLGIMKAVANSVLSNKGKAIGVIPEFLTSREIAHPNLTELIITKTMHERKVNIYDKSDGFIILPGGFGTLDEFFEITTWGQLGLHAKPIGILNINGFYDDLLSMSKKMVKNGFLKQANLDAVLIDSSFDELYNKMKNFKPLPIPKWLNIDKI